MPWSIATAVPGTIWRIARMPRRLPPPDTCCANSKNGAAAGAGFRLVYVDECDLHTHPQLVQVWQRRGCPFTVPAAGADQRRAVFGALDYGFGQVVWQIAERKGGEAFAAFLAHVGQTWPVDQIVLVMDNVSYHRSPVVHMWWAQQAGRLTPLWLPRYTPKLNLMERVWRFLEQKLACHRFWADVAALAADATLLDQLQACFHTDDPPGIRLLNNLCEAA